MPALEPSAAACRRARGTIALASLVLAAAAVGGTAADGGRDWSGVQLAWRDDPRPPVDAPAGVDPPSSRRSSRRTQRRAATRRRQLPDEFPTGPMTLPSGDIWWATPSATAPWGTGGFGTSDAVGGTGSPDVRQRQESVPTLAVPPATVAGAAAAITTHRDQPYPPGSPDQPPHGRQRFDIHLPAGCSAGGMPLVVWIHGDTWRDGSKADCPIVWLAREGYAVASIGYRPTDAAVFPAQLDDCRAAIAEIVRHADVWGIDPARVAVAGSGAGGHLAALVGLAGQPAAATADRLAAAPRIAAVFAAAAPTSLTTLGPEHDRATSAASRLVGGPLPEFREAAQRASPVAHVSADDPPVLLLHGAADAAVPPAQSVQLDAALRNAGVDTAVVMLAGVGHKPSLAQGTAGGVALLSFLDRVLGPGIRAAEPTGP